MEKIIGTVDNNWSQLYQSTFQMSAVKPKPNYNQWPITTNVNNTMNQWELSIALNTRNWCQVQESVCDQVMIGFGFASDWLSRRWYNLVFKPITEHSKVKPKQLFWITFNTQLKIALNTQTSNWNSTVYLRVR